MYKLVIVEDDVDIALNMKDYLEECGFNITIFTTIIDSTINISLNNYDIVLLDLNLPDYTGFELLKYLNKNKISIPTIVISADSDLNSKLEAFKLGADDYMTKPIDMEELEARVWVHLGKNSQIQSEKIDNIFEEKENNIFFKNIRLNLTRTEYKILSLLLKHKNGIVVREDLYSLLSSKSNERTLDYHIKNIRKKIAVHDDTKEYLATEYGVGYKLLF